MVEHDVAAAPQPAPPAVVAAAPAAGAVVGTAAVLSLQRTAGNRAVCRAIAAGLIQRDDTKVAVSAVSVAPDLFTVPLEAGVSVRAAADPADATGVKWALEKGTVGPAPGTKIDAKTGAISVAGRQPGGKLNVKATSDDDSTAEVEMTVIEKPTAIASTTGAETGSYEAQFTHTFKGTSATAAGLEGENINEKFDALTVPTPFGEFTLGANEEGSPGWDLDDSGTMAGPDSVSIEASMIDANLFIKSASNPKPAKSLPQSFTMSQHLHAKSLPSDTLGAAAFTSTGHVRRLEEKGGKLQVVIKAGKGEVAIDYTGPPVYRKAKADKPTVKASAPQPAEGDWTRNEVKVSVDVLPAGSSVSFSIEGEALDCEIDSDGKVLIGDKAGKLKVRAGDGDSHFDEVTITITPGPKPAKAPAP